MPVRFEGTAREVQRRKIGGGQDKAQFLINGQNVIRVRFENDGVEFIDHRFQGPDVGLQVRC